MDARTLYIDLLKNALTFSLWPEPPLPIQHMYYERHPLKKKLAQGLARFLEKRGKVLAGIRKISEEERVTGRMWLPGYAHSMVGRLRLDNIQFCVETVLKDGVPGDFIETGVWRGGSCILMKGLLDVEGVKDRKVFVADSFQGLPVPEEKYPQDKGDRHHEYDMLTVSVEDVRANFARYGVLDDNVVFLKGWFKDTLPVAPISNLAVIRLDGDMYSSTIEALESLYPKLSPGGFCIIDDYALKGCREAVDDFRAREGITAPIEEIDWSGVFWRKPF